MPKKESNTRCCRCKKLIEPGKAFQVSLLYQHPLGKFSIKYDAYFNTLFFHEKCSKEEMEGIERDLAIFIGTK